MDQFLLLRKAYLLETGLSLIQSLMGQSHLLHRVYLLEPGDDSFSGLESLTLIALSCNPKLSLAGQQTTAKSRTQNATEATHSCRHVICHNSILAPPKYHAHLAHARDALRTRTNKTTIVLTTGARSGSPQLHEDCTVRLASVGLAQARPNYS